MGQCPEGFGKSVTLLAASVATGVYRQLPRPDLHRQEHSAFHGALSAACSAGTGSPTQPVMPEGKQALMGMMLGAVTK